MRSRVNTSAEKKQLNKGVARVVTSHDRMREQLARDVEDYLAHGGQIKHLEPYVRSALHDNDQDVF